MNDVLLFANNRLDWVRIRRLSAKHIRNVLFLFLTTFTGLECETFGPVILNLFLHISPFEQSGTLGTVAGLTGCDKVLIGVFASVEAWMNVVELEF